MITILVWYFFLVGLVTTCYLIYQAAFKAYKNYTNKEL